MEDILSRTIAWTLSILLCCTASFTVLAQSENPGASNSGPADVIAHVTADVMNIVSEANTYFDEDPDRYFREIDAALAELVDWRGFATAVMGEYYSRGRTLDAAGREALKRQRDDFAVRLREGLIRSYAKGLLAFGGARMEVQGVEASPQSTRIASVTQLVYGDADRVYTIRYQMGQYKDGAWRLRNLIIETINLGEIYRNQFDSLARQAEGDLDRVIGEWNAVLAEPIEEVNRD
jgi:phospholipid transport system substrate-binding protein